jgi:hypothetical protein
VSLHLSHLDLDQIIDTTAAVSTDFERPSALKADFRTPYDASLIKCEWRNLPEATLDEIYKLKLSPEQNALLAEAHSLDIELAVLAAQIREVKLEELVSWDWLNMEKLTMPDSKGKATADEETRESARIEAIQAQIEEIKQTKNKISKQVYAPLLFFHTSDASAL